LRRVLRLRGLPREYPVRHGGDLNLRGRQTSPRTRTRRRTGRAGRAVRGHDGPALTQTPPPPPALPRTGADFTSRRFAQSGNFPTFGGSLVCLPRAGVGSLGVSLYYNTRPAFLIKGCPLGPAHFRPRTDCKHSAAVVPFCFGQPGRKSLPAAHGRGPAACALPALAGGRRTCAMQADSAGLSGAPDQRLKQAGSALRVCTAEQRRARTT
jgi:hypothetical protein